MYTNINYCCKDCVYETENSAMGIVFCMRFNKYITRNKPFCVWGTLKTYSKLENSNLDTENE